MQRWLLVAGLCACATPSSPPPAAPAAPALDDAAVTHAVYDFFETVDGRQVDRFADTVTDGFILFEAGYANTRDKLVKAWRESAASGRPARTRSCKSERIFRAPSSVTYIGDCVEHMPAHGDHKAEEFQGWNTVVLVREGARWKVALWQWQKSGIEAERAMWNDMYRRATGFNQAPNRLLVETVEGAKPGAALCVAMGQGRNALYLASQGWRVTGVDIADEGLRQARAAAAERGLELDAVLADLNDYDFGTERWDLVTMIYAGSDHGWIERAQDSLKSGGLFVVEFFMRDDESDDDSFAGFRSHELAKLFAGWDIVRDDEVEDTADWAGQRKARLVRFVARKP